MENMFLQFLGQLVLEFTKALQHLTNVVGQIGLSVSGENATDSCAVTFI